MKLLQTEAVMDTYDPCDDDEALARLLQEEEYAAAAVAMSASSSSTSAAEVARSRSPILVSPTPVCAGERIERDTGGSDTGSVRVYDLVGLHPDIHELFCNFDRMFFQSQLGSVEVKWSKKMTLCAGLCSYQGRGGLCSIKLSEPLLKFRGPEDLVDTLLHEMIHAYLFVAERNRDHDDHGPQFQAHMRRINNSAGTQITIYHSFVAEVEHYRQHWWRCEGACATIVKRAMNRAPGPYDYWFERHQRECGGNFVKIREPEGYGSRKRRSDATMGAKRAAGAVTGPMDRLLVRTDRKTDAKAGTVSHVGAGMRDAKRVAVSGAADCRKTAPPTVVVLDSSSSSSSSSSSDADDDGNHPGSAAHAGQTAATVGAVRASPAPGAPSPGALFLAALARRQEQQRQQQPQQPQQK